MKCALIIPSWRPEDIFPAETAGSQINYWQPLGTLYVAAALQKAGHEVAYFDGAFLGHEELIEAIAAFRPDVAGLYATTFGWKRASRMASDLRSRLPNSFLMTGGPFPSALPKQCLEECPSLDAAVSGEAEETVVEILARLESRQALDDLRGVTFRDHDSIRRNADRSLRTDLDGLPRPARDLLGDAARYLPPPATYRRKPVALILTSRGCDRGCIYCFQHDPSRRSGVRFRSVDNVLDEMEMCRAAGYREIKFIDDTLAADYDRASELARRIREKRLGLTWFASACVSQVDRRLLREFKEAGCWAILMGAESGVQKNLDAIRKGITLDQIRRAVRSAKDVGLQVFTPFLFGVPGETYEDGLRTIDFACELDPDVANFHALTPFPGTELYRNLDRYGTCSGNLEDFTYQGAAFVPHTMTRKEILQLRQEAFRRFYSRPGYLLRRAIRVRRPADIRAAVNGLNSLFWLWRKEDVFKNRGLISPASRP